MPSFRKTLDRVPAGTVAFGIAVLSSFVAALIILFLDTDRLGTRSLPSDITLTDGLGVGVLALGSILAAVVGSFGDRRSRLLGWKLLGYLLATSAGFLAIVLAYWRFWCDRATAVVTGLIDRNQDVLHWSARVPLADTGRHLDFDIYTREAEGVRVGHEFEVLVDPRGWSDPLKTQAADWFWPALAVAVAAYLFLFLISLPRTTHTPTPDPESSPSDDHR
jgi:hypothetical protein